MGRRPWRRASGNLEAVTSFETQYPDKARPNARDAAHLYLRVVGTPSAPGDYGHLGQYSRELVGHEVLEVHGYAHNDCAGR